MDCSTDSSDTIARWSSLRLVRVEWAPFGGLCHHLSISPRSRQSRAVSRIEVAASSARDTSWYMTSAASSAKRKCRSRAPASGPGPQSRRPALPRCPLTYYHRDSGDFPGWTSAPSYWRWYCPDLSPPRLRSGPGQSYPPGSRVARRIWRPDLSPAAPFGNPPASFGSRFRHRRKSLLSAVLWRRRSGPLSGQTGYDCRVIPVGAVSVQFHELTEYPGHIVRCRRTGLMS